MVPKNLFARQQWRNRHREKTYRHDKRGGEGEMYGESNKDGTKQKGNLCNIDIQWELAVCLRKLKQGLCINLEGCDGEGDGREFQEGGYICISMADSS